MVASVGIRSVASLLTLGDTCLQAGLFLPCSQEKRRWLQGTCRTPVTFKADGLSRALPGTCIFPAGMAGVLRFAEHAWTSDTGSLRIRYFCTADICCPGSVINQIPASTIEQVTSTCPKTVVASTMKPMTVALLPCLNCKTPAVQSLQDPSLVTASRQLGHPFRSATTSGFGSASSIHQRRACSHPSHLEECCQHALAMLLRDIVHNGDSIPCKVHQQADAAAGGTAVCGPAAMPLADTGRQQHAWCIVSSANGHGTPMPVAE